MAEEGTGLAGLADALAGRSGSGLGRASTHADGAPSDLFHPSPEPSGPCRLCRPRCPAARPWPRNRPLPPWPLAAFTPHTSGTRPSMQSSSRSRPQKEPLASGSSTETHALIPVPRSHIAHRATATQHPSTLIITHTAPHDRQLFSHLCLPPYTSRHRHTHSRSPHPHIHLLTFLSPHPHDVRFRIHQQNTFSTVRAVSTSKVPSKRSHTLSQLAAAYQK